MKILIESTDEIGTINGVQCRKWLGKTEAGVPCLVFVPRIAVAREHEAVFDVERLGTPVYRTGEADTPDGPPVNRNAWDARLFS